jgi:hypothetical protein
MTTKTCSDIDAKADFDSDRYHVIVSCYESCRRWFSLWGYDLFDGSKKDCETLVKVLDVITEQHTRGSQQINLCVRTKYE